MVQGGCSSNGARAASRDNAGTRVGVLVVLVVTWLKMAVCVVGVSRGGNDGIRPGGYGRIHSAIQLNCIFIAVHTIIYTYEWKKFQVR